MRPASRLGLVQQPFLSSSSPNPPIRPSAGQQRCLLHCSAPRPANPLPIVATGPPPAPPKPHVSESRERVDRRRRQAELLKNNQSLKGQGLTGKPREVLKRRFWKDVNIQRTPEGLHTIHLDARPVRSPQSKTPLYVPASKPHLATAIALEWDSLTSAQQALKTHLIPLTSLAARASDLAQQDAADAEAGVALGAGTGEVRRDIVRQLLKYFDTDTLLCWAPHAESADEVVRAAAAAAIVGTAPAAAASAASSSSNTDSGGGETAVRSLRAEQERVAAPITRYLATHVWPGVEIRPALTESSILPAPQPATTQAVVRAWLMGLGAWELAGLERATLATKSLCVAARLVCEWSENFPSISIREKNHVEIDASSSGDATAAGTTTRAPGRFTIDDAERACTVEVRWQIGQWGEVEDSHDVEREDLRRQLGGAVLLVSGTGSA